MPREAKIGPFKPVLRTSIYGRVLQHALAEPLTVAQIAERIGDTPDKVTKALKAARGNHGITYAVAEGPVTVTLPAGVTDPFRPEREAAARTAREPRQLKVGVFRQVRRNSGLGNLVATALAGLTVADMAAHLSKPEDTIVPALKSLRRSHGMEYSIGADGIVSLAIPEDDEPFFREREPRAPRQPGDGTRGNYKSREADEAAARGQMPEKPVILSPTNQHRQKHFDKLAEMAEAGSWDEVAAYDMKGVDSYSKLINKYRDRLLTAHNAQTQAAAAE